LLLRGKFDHRARSGKGPVLHHEPLADLDFLLFAGILIGSEVLRECLFGHQSDSFAHPADRIHGMYQRLGRSVEKITWVEFHRQKYQFLCALEGTPGSVG
jgi:hypothetical protein